MTTTIERETTFDLAQFARLRRRRDDLMAARRAAGEDYRGYLDERHRLEGLERERARAGIRPRLAPHDERLLARARAGEIAARAHRDDVERESEPICALVPRLEEFLRAERVDLALLPPPAPLPRPTTGKVPTAADVDSVRRRSAEARTERERIASSPASEAEAFAAVDAWLDSAAAGLDDLAVDPLVQGHAAGFRLLHRDVGAAETQHDRMILAGLFAETNRPALRKVLGGLVSARAQERGGFGLDAVAKSRRLAELDREIFGLELDEERSLRTMEAAGLAPMRRADADPRAVLALSRS